MVVNVAGEAKASGRLSAAVHRGLRESGAIAIAVLALVLMVALGSFDARDPGFFLGGTITSYGHALMDIRFAFAVRDVFAAAIGAEGILLFSFFFGDVR